MKPWNKKSFELMVIYSSMLGDRDHAKKCKYDEHL
jgi:hypothetical protein